MSNNIVMCTAYDDTTAKSTGLPTAQNDCFYEDRRCCLFCSKIEDCKAGAKCKFSGSCQIYNNNAEMVSSINWENVYMHC